MNPRGRGRGGAGPLPSGSGAAPARTEAASTPGARALVALLAAAVAVVAYRGALEYGFSQDDFLSLARVRGLVPRLAGPWRILANQWFWDAGVGLFGLEPRPFHAIVLCVHASGAALLAWLLSRRFPAPAAGLAAVLWAAHPSHYMALYWASANSDPFMTLFLLLATAAYFARGRARWCSPVAFAIALAWKESSLLFPLALAALAWLGPPPRRAARELARDPVLWSLLAVSAAWGAGIAAFVSGLHATSSAYAASPAAVARNLVTYAAWTPSWMGWLTRDASDAVTPVFLRWGAGVGAAALAALAWRAWRERGAAGALLAALLLLAPVLPLANHTYHYYLHAPLAAVAVAGAALFAAVTRAWSPRLRWAAAAAVATPLAFAAVTMLQGLEHAPFRLPGSRAEGTVDRALIAANAIADLRNAPLPAHTRLRLWSPQLQDMARQAAEQRSESSPAPGTAADPRDNPAPGAATDPRTNPAPRTAADPRDNPAPRTATDPRTNPAPRAAADPRTNPAPRTALSDAGGVEPIKESYPERNVRSALLDGLALRVAVPALDSAVFVREFSAADTSAWWAVYRWDGHLRAARTNDLARVIAAAKR